MQNLAEQADEAQELLERILIEAPIQLDIGLHQIGNGELVPRINRHYYIWTEEEWQQYAAERFARAS